MDADDTRRFAVPLSLLCDLRGPLRLCVKNSVDRRIVYAGLLLDASLVMCVTIPMTTLTVSKAKAQFSGIARKVIKTKQPVMIKTPTGYVQIVPFDVPEYVPPAGKGWYKPTAEEIRLGNTFGEAL